jgi:hypothetical protein
MKDLVTGNTIVECPIGFYDINTNCFLVVEPIKDITILEDCGFIMVIDHEDDIRDQEIYKILYEFRVGDLEESLDIYKERRLRITNE